MAASANIELKTGRLLLITVFMTLSLLPTIG
jgi:hypothetical protein